MNNLLSLLIFIPSLGAGLIGVSLALPLRKEQRDQLARWIALVASAISCLIGIYLWITYDGSAVGKIQYLERSIWIPSLNIEYFVGVDGISVSLVILSTLISFIATIASMPWWAGRHEHHDPAHPHFSVVKVPGYMTMLLFLQTGMSGTFAALDMFLFFVFWEVMLLPMYFLIGIWGGPRKEYAAIKFFLFTLAGSVLLLLAIIALYYRTGDQALLQRLANVNPEAFRRLVSAGTLVMDPKTHAWAYPLADGTLGSNTFNMLTIAKLGQAGLFDLVGPFLAGIPFAKMIWAFMFIAFAVKVPMVPLHTWLPDAHVEAPTPISVILAGILLKMGIYGMLRMNWAMLPAATASFAPAVSMFGVINIVYAAMVCLAQRDLKKLIAYSSVSHMGFSLLGMASMTESGMAGAVLNLFTHGIISPMLFLIVGVIYDRAHHREIEGFGGIAKVVPEYTALMGLAFFASLGLPGLAGFVSEFLVLNGAFAHLPWHTQPQVRPSAGCELERAADALSTRRAGHPLWVLSQRHPQADQHRPVRARSKRERGLSPPYASRSADHSRERAESSLFPARNSAHPGRDGDLHGRPRRASRSVADFDHRGCVDRHSCRRRARDLLRFDAPLPGQRAVLHPDAATGRPVLWVDRDRSLERSFQIHLLDGHRSGDLDGRPFPRNHLGPDGRVQRPSPIDRGGHVLDGCVIGHVDDGDRRGVGFDGLIRAGGLQEAQSEVLRGRPQIRGVRRRRLRDDALWDELPLRIARVDERGDDGPAAPAVHRAGLFDEGVEPEQRRTIGAGPRGGARFVRSRVQDSLRSLAHVVSRCVRGGTDPLHCFLVGRA